MGTQCHQYHSWYSSNYNQTLFVDFRHLFNSRQLSKGHSSWQYLCPCYICPLTGYNCCGHICTGNIYVANSCPVWTKIVFLPKIIYGVLEFFSSLIFFQLKSKLCIKMFWTQHFIGFKETFSPISACNYFGSKLFVDQTYFWLQIFELKNLLLPEIFEMKN